MATQYQFGQELNQNVRRGPNINAETRNHAIRMLQGGCTVKEVADVINRSVCTVSGRRSTPAAPCSQKGTNNQQ
ncbi:hypothetical protein EJ02DRAFT_164695 [Clathrospora elynae]|uniref:Uncharacterized protein n=1 Tax=Clathrospora elynae TaxID=706981 RepID=A0A6A5SS22_9PLEO|nr:hypothetical protein EJ02DRAFT_164695 [Clathrospora elynae]